MIGDDGAILVYIENGVVQRRLFAASPDRQHTKTFVDVMNEYPHAPIYMLVDILDQSYVKHSLPPVTPLGLNKLVNRRLDRDFAKEDIKGALNLGREQKGRKDWNFLLISISASSVLQGWLDIILDLPNRFAGIYLLPVECEQIIPQFMERISSTTVSTVTGLQEHSARRRVSLPRVKKEKKSSVEEGVRWQILVSHHKVGGFRQVVLKDGRLVFTRISQGAEGATPELTAGNIEQEVLNTIEYLKRLSLSEANSLNVVFIVAQEVKNHISRDRIPCNQAYMFTPYEASELLELKQAVLSADRYGDMVLATTFAMLKKPRLKLNPTYALRLEKLYQAILGVRLAAGLATAVSILTILMNVFHLPGNFIELQKVRDQQSAKQSELSQLSGTGDSINATANQINDLIAIHDYFQVDPPSYMEAVLNVSKIASDSQAVMNFNWILGNVLREEESKPVQVKMDLETEITFRNNQLKKIAEDKDAFYKTLAATFPDYTVTVSEDGNQSATDKLSFSLEDPEGKNKTGVQTARLKVSLSPKDPSAEMVNAEMPASAVVGTPPFSGGAPVP